MGYSFIAPSFFFCSKKIAFFTQQIAVRTMLRHILTFTLMAALVFCPALPLRMAKANIFTFDLADEMKMGREMAMFIQSSFPLIEDPEVKLYIKEMVDGIVAVLPPQPYPFHTYVIYEPSLNAFASPGGYVFVHSGLIQSLETESQLAGVLAHEIAHVTQRHIASRIQRGQLITIATLLASVAGIALASSGNAGPDAIIAGAGAAGAAAMLSYSRADESDADNFGIQYMQKAGYNPKGLMGAFSVMQRNQWGRGVPQYLSTHPDLQARISSMSSRLQSLPEEITNRKDDNVRFFRVQSLVWGHYGDIRQAPQFFASKSDSDPYKHMGLGIIASRQNNIAAASASFQKALQLAPNDPLIIRETGIFEFEKGNLAAAHAHLTTALAKNPKDYMASFFLARVLDEQGAFLEAQKYYQEVLRYVPEDAEVLTFYGNSLGKNGKQFEGFITLAYAAVYVNDEDKTETWLNKAKPLAKNPEQIAALEKFQKIYKERKEQWRKAEYN